MEIMACEVPGMVWVEYSLLIRGEVKRNSGCDCRIPPYFKKILHNNIEKYNKQRIKWLWSVVCLGGIF